MRISSKIQVTRLTVNTQGKMLSPRQFVSSQGISRKDSNRPQYSWQPLPPRAPLQPQQPHVNGKSTNGKYSSCTSFFFISISINLAL